MPAAAAAVSLLVCLALPAALEARPRPMRFERLSIEEGLSQSVVNAILQDSTGFLWLGTQDGLNRYDGYGFEIYRHDAEDPSSLPHDFVQTLVEDPAGDLWIGTEGGGLIRWRRASDSFEAYRHDPGDAASLSGDRVVDLAWDCDGTLWIATFASGLNLLVVEGSAAEATAPAAPPARVAFEHLRHDSEDPRSLGDDRVRVVYEDRSGRMWIGTLGGLDLFDPGERTFTHFRHHPGDARSLSDDRVRAIVEDRRGALWVGTHGGLNRLDPRTGVFQRYLHDPGDPSSLSQDWVRSLLADDGGRLWAGTDGGLNLWQEESGSFASYQPDPADPRSLANGQIVRLYQDRGGILWIGTLGGGLGKWNPGTWSFPHYWSEDAVGGSNVVFAISEDSEGALWIGTFGGGLERIDRNPHGVASARLRRDGVNGRRARYRHDPQDPGSLGDDRVTALLHDRHGVLWAGTVSGGLQRREAGSESFEKFRADPADPESLSANAVTVLFEDRRGRLWIGTHGGGLNLHRGGGVFLSFRHQPGDGTSLGNDRVLSLTEDRDGFLWLATDGGGLNRLHPATGAFLRVEHDPKVAGSLASNELNVVHVDASGRLWVGHEGNGLDRLDRLDDAVGQATFRNFSRADGLPSDNIWGIRSDLEGDLWLSTNGGGLARLDPETEAIKTYTVSHGLQSNEFNKGADFASPSGELFFGGVNGFNAFFPDRLVANSHLPPVVLTSFTKTGRRVRLDRPVYDVEAIALGYRDYFFSFEVAALDFTAPQENRYRYKLEGFDADWVDLGNGRQVTFTNLDAGHYTLRLQGSNNDGLWNEEGASVEISVAPPPWQSWWAWTLYVLAAAGITGAFVHRQRREVELERANARREREIARLERDNAQRERTRSEERRQLLEELGAKNEELERFNYTVSHDLKSPLVTIKGFLGLLEKDALAGNADRLKHDVRRIGAAADRMRRLLDELLELSTVGRRVRPPEEVSLALLASEALENLAAQVAEHEVEVVIDPDLPVVVGDRVRLQQLVQNLLANAVKYLGDQKAPRVDFGIRLDLLHLPPSGGTPPANESTTGQTVLFVRDNGVGIDERYHERVFGLFERLDAGDEGTGVGLALAKRIVEMHGGRIWVESEGLGHGSAFCFTLSGMEVEDAGEAEPEQGRVVEAGDRFRRSSAAE